MIGNKNDVKYNNNKKKGLTILLISCLIIIVTVFFVGKHFNNQPIKTQNKLQLEQNVFQYQIDFESNQYMLNTNNITSDMSLSGTNSGLLKNYKSYSPSVLIPIPTNDSSEISNLNIKFWINPTSSLIDATLVFSILDQNNKQIHWEGYKFNELDIQANNWHSFHHKFTFPKNLISTRNTIKVYLWNQDKLGNAIYIDDMYISLKENIVQESPRSKLIDFEDMTGKKISSKHSKSGFYSTFAKGADDFSTAILIPMSDIKYDNINSIAYSFNILAESPIVDAAFVVSIIDSTNTNVLWHSTHVDESNFVTNTWQIANGNVISPKEAISPHNTIKIYLWNRNDTEIYIDDVYLVIKENTNNSDDEIPACNLTKTQKFEKITNHPPYDFLFYNCVELKEKNLSELNKAFTKSKYSLSSNFIDGSTKDQLLCIYKNHQSIISFNENEIITQNIKFLPAINENDLIFADNGIVFDYQISASILSIYSYNSSKKEFAKTGEITDIKSELISGISSNLDNSISIVFNTGTITTYIYSEADNSYSISNSKTIISPNRGNLKYLKANIFGQSEQIILIYFQNNQNKYVVLDYISSTHTWSLSELHANKSIQSFDKLEFLNDFFICNYDNTSESEILQFSITERFDLRLLKFNKMSYNILYNIGFAGFQHKQNPKYYEIVKIIAGDFHGDNRTEIIVFKDNMHKIDWLTQKVEMYSFE